LLALGLLNAGVWLVCAGVLAGPPALAALGRVAELAAAGTMALNIWVRARASGISAM
jgi:hypothetical protein